MSQLILASSSQYRKSLLSRLKVPFDSQSPNVNETVLPGETAKQLVLRLAETKATALSQQFNQHFIIGSDQVAVHGDRILTKPRNYYNAFEQLRYQSGQRIQFLTSIALLDSHAKEIQLDVIITEVVFRPLTDHDIEYYLTKDEPYDCAGSFKSEGLGITLFEGIYGSDPTALVGLPLIRLSEMLRCSNYLFSP